MPRAVRSGIQPLRERGEIAREEQEEAVTYVVHRQRATFPDAVDLGDRRASRGVVDRQFALEPDTLRQPFRIDRLQFAQRLCVSATSCSIASRCRPREFRRSRGCRPTWHKRSGSSNSTITMVLVVVTYWFRSYCSSMVHGWASLKSNSIGVMRRNLSVFYVDKYRPSVGVACIAAFSSVQGPSMVKARLLNPIQHLPRTRRCSRRRPWAVIWKFLNACKKSSRSRMGFSNRAASSAEWKESVRSASA